MAITASSSGWRSGEGHGMTETEWATCDRAWPMLEYLDGQVSDRKVMLFSVACLRRIWHLLTDDRSRTLVDATERFVDDPVPDEWCRAYETFYAAYEAGELKDGVLGNTHEAVENAAHRGIMAALTVAIRAADAVGFVAGAAVPVATPDECSPREKTAAWEGAAKAEQVIQARLLRDIIGNPFRPCRLDRSRLTPQVVQLAEAIYDERAFDRLPELAQALDEAACAEQAILEHCRQPGPHVRGCWVLDLLVAKEEGMTEAQWLACDDPQFMWWHLTPKPGPRKQLLFAAACCRRIWDLFPDDDCRRAVEVSERLADGQATQEERSDAVRDLQHRAFGRMGHGNPDRAVAAAATVGSESDAITPAVFAAEASGRPDEAAAQAALLRDIVGNPFRTVEVQPSWMTPAVRQTAAAIYEHRAFERMPELARALENAGCMNADMLDHCRAPGPHVRGCWVLELIRAEGQG
jgi:hypothetical protein